MNYAVLFQGQGKYKTSYVKEMCEKYLEAKEIWKQAAKILQFDILKILEETEDAGTLPTVWAQPIIFMMEYSAWYVFHKGIDSKPMYMAGHSLGEYVALAAAGMLSFEDALMLVKARGEFMDQNVDGHEYGMLALLGCSVEKAEELCIEAENNTNCKVYCANFNSDSQIIVSGEKKGIEYLSDHADIVTKRMALKKAFHTPFMKNAAEQFKSVLSTVKFSKGDIEVISNVTAMPYQAEWTIPELLYRQIFTPVHWNDIMLYLRQKGVMVYLQATKNKLFRNMSLECNEYAQWGSLEDLSQNKIVDYDTGYRKEKLFSQNTIEFCGAILKRMLTFPWREPSEEKIRSAQKECRKIEELSKHSSFTQKDAEICAYALRKIFYLKGYSTEFTEQEITEIFRNYGINHMLLVN